ncbi:hypothetical protein CUC53_02150 [Aeromonas cavernicola]|uniref:Uncharacterized protein n=1 Tax=Aeromonas cavernicola TaxID=1006623 RepID=A0A2H9U8N1_9GAMM|nr:hypothetical protein CUC53_02150 [Aeromonas cavernicola]
MNRLHNGDKEVVDYTRAQGRDRNRAAAARGANPSKVMQPMGCWLMHKGKSVVYWPLMGLGRCLYLAYNAAAPVWRGSVHIHRPWSQK